MKDLMVKDTGKVPAYLKGLEEDTRGTENVTKEDLIIPRLGLIQALSPQIDENESEYIKGVKMGQMFNTVTQKIYGDTVLVVPVLYEKFFLLWRERKKGGGFGGQYMSPEAADAAIAEQEEQDGWEIVETPTMLCLCLSDDKVSEIAVTMPVSKAKVSRQWNSMIRMLGGPCFSRVYSMAGVQDTNNAGEKYFNFKVDQAGFPSEDVFKAAEQLYEEITSGEKSYTVAQDEEA